MKYAAFFRNVNLGHPRQADEGAARIGVRGRRCQRVASFLSNGTLVFMASGEARARKIVADACKTLRAECGLDEPACVRRLRALAELVAADPFAPFASDGDVYERCVSFFIRGNKADALPAAPLTSARRDLEIVRFTEGEACSIARLVNGRAGNPTALLEKRLSMPVTTRNWSTVVRLVEKHG